MVSNSLMLLQVCDHGIQLTLLQVSDHGIQLTHAAPGQ